MRDEEIGELFNKAISKMAPEAVDMLWPDVKKPVEEQIKNYVNSVLENATIANLARRLFNIR
jgi:isocitrate lyase